MSPTINECTLTELQRAGYSEAEIEEMASVAIAVGTGIGASHHEIASKIRAMALRSSDEITDFIINTGESCMNPERIYAAMMVADTMGASMNREPQGGLFAKSYDKDFNRKKKHRKMAKASKRRNRKNLRSRKCI